MLKAGIKTVEEITDAAGNKTETIIVTVENVEKIIYRRGA